LNLFSFSLLENVRVKRAGFCFRDKFESFMERYKMLSQGTWPNYRGDAKTGCKEIMTTRGLGKEDYQLGRTKIFIKNPITVCLKFFFYSFFFQTQKKKKIITTAFPIGRRKK